MDRRRDRNEPSSDEPAGEAVVHFHMRTSGALCGSQGGEGVYNGEGVNCPRCEKLMQIDEPSQQQIEREQKAARDERRDEP